MIVGTCPRVIPREEDLPVSQLDSVSAKSPLMIAMYTDCVYSVLAMAANMTEITESLKFLALTVKFPKVCLRKL